MKPAIERHGMAWLLSYKSLRDSSLPMNDGAHLSEVPTCPTSYLSFPPPKHLILYHYLLFFLKFKKLKSGSQELPQCTGVQEYQQVSGSFLFKSSHPYIPKDQSVHMKIGDHFVHSTSQGFTYPAFEEFHEIISHSNLASSALQPRLQAIGAADYIYILYRIASHSRPLIRSFLGVLTLPVPFSLQMHIFLVQLVSLVRPHVHRLEIG
ncbi:uncharacterized protein C8R40DRAFT_609304 [Lentinula edodes]|uniref:uncharacterized protein n=1 Tax=Lentinula edodes TaxID=5353 RepID=UPI001E8DF0C6|nr:uncharacterized protein C8R40DRAFT_609304 [Lentinula edodes]KAH7871042.1 hypothetical protein C8R40DRAFT_609304 [Lentinula edodes]